jgi:hypothetical protein
MAKLLVVGASRGIGLERSMLPFSPAIACARWHVRQPEYPFKNAALDKGSGDALDSDTIRSGIPAPI